MTPPPPTHTHTHSHTHTHTHYHHHHLPVFMVSRVTGHPVVPFRMIYNNIISRKHSRYPQLLGTSYTFSGIISLKTLAIFMRKGKQYIMLPLYKNLLEMMPCDNNAFMHVSTHKNIHIFSNTMLRYISSYKYKTWH